MAFVAGCVIDKLVPPTRLLQCSYQESEMTERRASRVNIHLPDEKDVAIGHAAIRDDRGQRVHATNCKQSLETGIAAHGAEKWCQLISSDWL